MGRNNMFTGCGCHHDTRSSCHMHDPDRSMCDPDPSEFHREMHDRDRIEHRRDMHDHDQFEHRRRSQAFIFDFDRMFR